MWEGGGGVCVPTSRDREPGGTGTRPLSGVGEGWWRVASLEDWAEKFEGTSCILLGLCALGLGPSSAPLPGDGCASQLGWLPASVKCLL